MNDQILLHFDSIKDALLEGLLTKSFEIDTADVQDPEVLYNPAMFGVGADVPLFDEEDRDILMHREAHFASNFDLMLTAYKEESEAAVLDIDIDRIIELKHLEEKLGKSIAPLLLHAQDALILAQVRKMYRLFSEVLQEQKSPLFCMVAELILEEDPLETIEQKWALFTSSGRISASREGADAEKVNKAQKCNDLKDSCISSLITIIQSDVLYDALFPGYGMAPIRAAHILGTLKAKDAIPFLFYMLDASSFDAQSAALQALRSIGKEAEEFCIKNLLSRPFSKNNELAAMALASFDCDDLIAEALILQLKDQQVVQKEPLIFYILACCEALPENARQEFYTILENSSLPKEVADEMRFLTQVQRMRDRIMDVNR